MITLQDIKTQPWHVGTGRIQGATDIRYASRLSHLLPLALQTTVQHLIEKPPHKTKTSLLYVPIIYARKNDTENNAQFCFIQEQHKNLEVHYYGIIMTISAVWSNYIWAEIKLSNYKKVKR